MTMRKKLVLALMVMFTFTFAGISTVSAKKAKESGNQGLAAGLGTISWGDTKDDVLKKMKKQLMEEAKKDPKVKRDPLLLQKARKAAIDRHKAAEKSFTRLEGKDTGYEVSVIGDEFSANNGESFIRVKDRVAQRFYFFIDGRFYKLVVAYNAAYLRDTKFETFIATSARKYGRPTSAEYDEIGGEEELALVTWKDPETTMSVKNKKELFDTFTMVFADRQTLKRLAGSKRRVGGSDKDPDELSAQVKDLMDSSGSDSNRAVVDNITGTGVKVDLKEGRPVDDQAREEENQEGGDAASDDGGKEKKEKKKKKKKSKKKKSTKAPDFSKLKAGSDDDLIIY